MVRQRKVLVLLGTKAQFVKMAPVLLEMDRREVPYTLVYSGQHSETFQAMETAFGTRRADASLMPDFEADSHVSFLHWTLTFWLTALKTKYRGMWREHSVIVVHGDTASTLYGAMLGRFFGSRVAHVEAGLRSPSLFDPFPEEMIRRIVSRLSTLHYCPDEWACSNLSRVSGDVINTGGNTILDSLQSALEHVERIQSTPVGKGSTAYGIVSMHRNENLSSAKRFDTIMSAILKASEISPLKFIMHPTTRKRLQKSGWLEKLSAEKNIHLLDRMDYFQFIVVMSKACFLLTDGGSNQEEAAQLGIPCLLLRRSTERRDGLGHNVEISDLEPHKIIEFVHRNRSSDWKGGAAGPSSSSPSRLIAQSLNRHCN